MGQAVNGLSGTNLTRVKDFNESVVLDLIRSAGEMTRPSLAAMTGLRLQTVSNIVARLMSENLLLEREDAKPEGGRPARHLMINPHALRAIGIVLMRSELSVGLVNLAGEVEASERVTLTGAETPEEILRALTSTVQRLVEASVDSEAPIVGCGIGVPGPLDLRTGRILNVIDFPGWADFALRDEIERRLGLPVVMDNDITARALGEKWHGASRSADSSLYAYFAHRAIGAGIVSSGDAYRGSRGNTGEIAHIQAVQDGPPCDCGNRGCLGVFATPEGLLREARKAVLEFPPHTGAQPPAFPENWHDVASGDDALFIAVRQRISGLIARVVTDLVRVLDPEMIVFAGPLSQAMAGDIEKAVELEMRLLSDVGYPLPALRFSAVDPDAGIIGAATLVLHEYATPSLTKLNLAPDHAAVAEVAGAAAE